MFHRFSLFSWNFFEFLYLCAQNESAIKEFCGTFLQKSSAVPNTPRSSKRSVELFSRNPTLYPTHPAHQSDLWNFSPGIPRRTQNLHPIKASLIPKQ